jgi:hypothetical protein
MKQIKAEMPVNIFNKIVEEKLELMMHDFGHYMQEISIITDEFQEPVDTHSNIALSIGASFLATIIYKIHFNRKIYDDEILNLVLNDIKGIILDELKKDKLND